MLHKIVYFTKYDRNGASSRLRSYQFIEKLKLEKNVEVTTQILFSSKYLDLLYQNKSTKSEAIKGYFNRFLFLLTIFKYNKIVIEKEFFPYLPAIFEQILSFLGVKFIVDYDDAIFHNYDKHPNKLFRFLLGNKIANVMRSAETVIAGNKYLADYAINANAKSVIIIPTVIDLNRYPQTDYVLSDLLKVGWIGTPKTIRLLEGNLNYIFHNHQNKFKFITIGGELQKPEVPYEFVKWTEDTEVHSILNLNVGIMPLLDSDFEKGKCGYKLIQYMACGIPVIASAVGANVDIVSNGQNGFLVNQNSDWERHIKYFVQNPDKLKILGENARKTVEEKYTLQVQYPIIKQLLNI